MLACKIRCFEESRSFRSKILCSLGRDRFMHESKKAGYKVLYVPKAKIWHKHSAPWNKIKPIQIYYLTRNRFLFVRKHATLKEFIAFLLYFFGLKAVLSFCIARDIKGWLSFLNGVVDLVRCR